MRILIALLSVLATGCSSPYYIKTIHDPVDGYTIQRMEGLLLNRCGGHGDGDVYLHPQRHLNKSGERKYSLIVRYRGSSWLFIELGESLVLLVDGERMGFVGAGSRGHRHTEYDGQVVERAWYAVSSSDLVRIANAKDVRVKVRSSGFFLERCFSEDHFEAYKEFVNEYVMK